jgi:ECF transporter S component (folate family)
MDRASINLRRVTISALLLSLSLVLKTVVSVYIPMFGQNGMRIGVSGIFSMIPAFLFGPAYGAIVSGLSDLLGYLLKPMGAYLPLMTLIVAFGGFLRGALWAVLRGRSSRKMRIVIAVFSLLLLALGICNLVFLSADGINEAFYANVQAENIDTGSMHRISQMLIARTINTKDPSGNLATYATFLTTGVIASAVLGLLLLVADWLLSRKLAHTAGIGQIPQLLFAMIVSGLIVTTLNTIVLRETIYASWKVLPFAVVWIPRIVEEILGNTVKAYFIAALLGIGGKQRGLRELTNYSFGKRRV